MAGQLPEQLMPVRNLAITRLLSLDTKEKVTSTTNNPTLYGEYHLERTYEEQGGILVLHQNGLVIALLF